jgi:diguanylate cyclase (GGDEF)-like protein/PAS domain S-box-containing protein
VLITRAKASVGSASYLHEPVKTRVFATEEITSMGRVWAAILRHVRRGLLAYTVLGVVLSFTLYAWYVTAQPVALSADGGSSTGQLSIPRFEPHSPSWMVLFGGVSVSVLLAWMVWWRTRNIFEYQREAEERKRLSSVMEMTAEFIAFFNPDGKQLYVNAAGRKMLGIEERDIVHMTMFDLYPPAMLNTISNDVIPAASRDGTWQGESALLHRDGHEVAVAQTVLAHTKPNGKVEFLSTIAHDITERKQAERRLFYLAQYDSLTGLPNRSLFHDRLEQATSRAMRNEEMLALMFLDLDRFKSINDTLGHAVGDQLLKSVSERLKLCLRDVDTVARLSGDEFTIILEEITQAQQAATVARKILELFARPVVIQGNEIYTTLSIGIVLYPLHAANIETMLRRADSAMYYAKQQGRNNFQFYQPSMEIAATESLDKDHMLRQALQNEQLVLYYQPQVSVKTGKLIGVEALLRWKHPELGLVPAREFIGLAEKTGLIIPIGEWVMERVCAQSKAWRQAGLEPPRINVNITASQFKQTSLVKLIETTCANAGLLPGCLGIEVAEAVLMEDRRASTDITARLSAMGVHVSMVNPNLFDPSLAHLEKFQLHSLKLDQLAASGPSRDPQDIDVATSMLITLAHGEGLKVIAERVETQGQLSFLRGQACDGVQGNLLSQPLSAQELAQLLQQMKDWKPGLNLAQWAEVKTRYSIPL